MRRRLGIAGSRLRLLFVDLWISKHLLSRIWRGSFTLLIPLLVGRQLNVLVGVFPPELHFDQLVKQLVIVFAVIAALALIADIFRLAAHKAALTFSEAVRRPFPSTTDLFEKTSDPAAQVLGGPVGGAIEVFRVPLRPRPGAAQGLEFDKILIDRLGALTPPDLGIEEIKPIADPDNGRKYSLVEFYNPLTDRSHAKFGVRETDWNTVIPWIRYAQKNQKLRHDLVLTNEEGGLLPESSRLPNIFCIHAVAAFSDDSLLVLRRGKTEFSPEKYSVSFEEQLSELDLRNLGRNGAAGMWIKRAVCEEIFPLQSSFEHDPEATWRRVEKYVDQCRFWSLIHEELIGGWAACAAIRLSMRPQVFGELYAHLMREHADVGDKEGRLMYLPRENLDGFIKSGKAQVRSLFGGGEYTMEQLHPTSLYRAILFSSTLS